ncbi:putative short chain dehydrogenase/reductase [Xylariaceae sp. FL0594]|nr:putative short chain dehydrogenase/reductase [Xylariaceae sp. FL0594]
MAANKTIILVTGANGGIGYETVAALAQTSADFHVYLSARSEEKGKAALSEIRAAYGNSLKGTISVVRLDVNDQETITTAKEQIEKEFGRLDVLINNAGMSAYQEPDEVKATRQTFEVNVLGQMMVTNTLEPLLKRSAKPYVIYVSSGQGSITLRLDPNGEFTKLRGDSYRISKAALNMLAACHRHNFADWESPARVLAFNPSFCVTNLTGEEARASRIQLGARDAKQPAHSLVDVVLGKRDDDIAKNGMIDTDGGLLPW